MVHITVLTPVKYESLLKQKKIVVRYGYDDTPFGKCLIASIDGKICHFSFINDSREKRFESLKKEWPKSSFVSDPVTSKSLLERMLNDDDTLEVIMRGTAFQESVWRALMNIKKGETMYYSDVACAVGCPKATRAVANAIAKNPVSYLVPCHRVISKCGDIYKYGGGCETKKKLLSFEGFRHVV